MLGTANISATSYGAFAGYNTQWQDLIIGIEANLAHAGLNLNAPSTPIGPLITGADSQGFTHTVRITATGSVTNLDFATLRARAGYVFGSFLPYGFIGPAFGTRQRVRDVKPNGQRMQFEHTAGLWYGFI